MSTDVDYSMIKKIKDFPLFESFTNIFTRKEECNKLCSSTITSSFLYVFGSCKLEKWNIDCSGWDYKSIDKTRNSSEFILLLHSYKSILLSTGWFQEGIRA